MIPGAHPVMALFQISSATSTVTPPTKEIVSKITSIQSCKSRLTTSMCLTSYRGQCLFLGCSPGTCVPPPPAPASCHARACESQKRVVIRMSRCEQDGLGRSIEHRQGRSEQDGIEAAGA